MDVDEEEVVDVDASDVEDVVRVSNRAPKPSQAITCCVALPMAYGIGFVLSSAGGVISIFKPSETNVPENEVTVPFCFHYLSNHTDSRNYAV